MTSGHWDKFREHMFVTEYENRMMGLKPMNCPGHCKLFSLQQHSYRDLPVRYFEPGLLHRREPSGTLHGLLRVRHFAQDDAHIFCTEEQIQEEVAGCLEFAFATYAVFGLEVRLELSTRPDQRIGSDDLWDRSEAALQSALESHGLEYDVNEGDGAFYGPKIDMHMTDSLGRSWQLGTVQLDYNMPARFGLDVHRRRQRRAPPVMIHRALMGSYERFIGILLEHWQASSRPGSRRSRRSCCRSPIATSSTADAVTSSIARHRLRAEADKRGESVSRKIRDAELRKIPYMLVVGDREQEAGEVSVREHRHGDLGSMGVDAFVESLQKQVQTRSMG